ncbi:MAG: DJ-1/PfpI family protein [Defluviitaleaceae bacterium]|nr:DJ-1/PfpI family protein [Defluviitaleaceae bacterium]
MYEAIVFLAEGFEEIEAIGTLDILRRGGVKAASVSLTGQHSVTGAHGITIQADIILDQLPGIEGTMLIISCDGSGIAALHKHEILHELLKLHHSDSGKIAAICAAPTILGKLGILADKTAVCYPSLANNLKAARYGETSTVTDGNITTSKSAGTTMDFALELVRIIKGSEAAAKVAVNMQLI